MRELCDYALNYHTDTGKSDHTEFVQ
ncbi:hypothetical protein Zm00014a_042996 [Zea mays]|uniref:Uncharacterized protein n=1 Tax=Zea mays TaxID=4577 RepID=A0A3L6F133_MAIZE|nr:hypothetical protein Zm00014a_042996 [Zea mays]